MAGNNLFVFAIRPLLFLRAQTAETAYFEQEFPNGNNYAVTLN